MEADIADSGDDFVFAVEDSAESSEEAFAFAVDFVLAAEVVDFDGWHDVSLVQTGGVGKHSLEQGFGGFESGGRDAEAFFEAAEPGALAFGELAGVCLDLLDGFREGELVLEVEDKFAVAECLGGGAAELWPVEEELVGFFEPTMFEHLLCALSDSVSE